MNIITKEILHTVALYYLSFTVIALLIAWPKERDFVCIKMAQVPELAISGQFYWPCEDLRKLPLSTEGILWPKDTPPTSNNPLKDYLNGLH